MTKHRKTRRSQKGGGFLDSIFGSSDPYAPKKPTLIESMFGTSTSTGTGTGTSTTTYQSPNQSSSSLFGSPNQSQSSSFFGSSNPNQSQSSSFFGSSNPNQNQSSSFFGNSTQPQNSVLGQNANLRTGNSSFNSPARSNSYGPGIVTGYGGKRGKRSMTKGMTKGKTMKGGKGGLGLSYYASPVSDLKVAEPTSWQYYANGTNQYSVTGGSKSSRTRKLTKSRTRKSRKLTKGKSRK